MLGTITMDSISKELPVKLVEFARGAMQKFVVPGAAMGFWINGWESYAALGVTSLENPLPVTPETLFQAGSITKTLTATMIFQQVEHGKIDLEDKVRRYIPDFKVHDNDASTQVKVWHLLNHTAGWKGDYNKNTGDGDDALKRYVESMADLPQLAPLGSCYAYNNASFDVAGRIVEIVCDKPYETAVQEKLLEPLEMDRSFFFPAQVMEHRFVAGHILDGDQIVETSTWAVNRGEAPDGGLVSNVRDLIKYARFHMGDGTTLQGERLLDRESLKRMQTPTIETGNGCWMGMNWFIYDVDGVRFLRHGGETRGQSAILWIAPELEFAFTALNNVNRCASFHQALFEWVCEHYLHAAFPRLDR
ncbi:MAG: beta-lactamase family protein [Anaerolineales bacterium]|nr:beta-lactamase family protein [Anaerolineales bacterium]